LISKKIRGHYSTSALEWQTNQKCANKTLGAIHYCWSCIRSD